MSSHDEAYLRAKARVQEIRAWYVHFTIFVVVNAAMTALDLITGGGIEWAYWPLLGWGIGMAIHTSVVWIAGGPFGRQWEERKIQELMDRERRTMPDTEATPSQR